MAPVSELSQAKSCSGLHSEPLNLSDLLRTIGRYRSDSPLRSKTNCRAAERSLRHARSELPGLSGSRLIGNDVEESSGASLDRLHDGNAC